MHSNDLTLTRVVCLLLITVARCVLAAEPQPSRILHVPEDYDTVQAAIDAARDRDRVMLAPGEYRESVVISGKSIMLCSQFADEADPQIVEQTILSGAVPEDDSNEGRAEQVILIKGDAGPGTVVTGLTIRDGDDGISCHARVTISHCRIVENVDGIDYEGGGGVCEHNYFTRNEDDAIDLDLGCAVEVEHNRLVNNLDDGIEIRLQPYDGELLEILISRNVIAGNAEDGIQIIDYPGVTPREIRIEGNLIVRNTMAGIGFMSDANTKEDYSAADIPEAVEIVANTIADNTHGLSGGGNVRVSQNTFIQHQESGVRSRTLPPSLSTDNLFWSNMLDWERLAAQTP